MNEACVMRSPGIWLNYYCLMALTTIGADTTPIGRNL